MSKKRERTPEEERTHQVALAAICFKEVFKKMIRGSIPPEILTKLQMDIMLTLQTLGPSSMSALSARIGVAPEQITRAVKTLREGGLVSTERNPQNRRVVVASLSTHGAALIREHSKAIHERINEYLQAIGEEEADRLACAAREANQVLFAHSLDDPATPTRTPIVGP